jgi:hypothetical protein
MSPPPQRASTGRSHFRHLLFKANAALYTLPEFDPIVDSKDPKVRAVSKSIRTADFRGPSLRNKKPRHRRVLILFEEYLFSWASGRGPIRGLAAS